MSTIRGFFAIQIPAAMQTILQRAEKTLQQKHRLRWTKPHNLHITLQFLKEIKTMDIENIVANVRKELSKMTSFELELGKLELFPSPVHPRLIALQVGPSETLAQLSHLIGQGILGAHYPIETRPFRGHLTLARFNGANQHFPLEDLTLPPLQKFPVTEIILFQSLRGEEGSRYIPLAHIHL